MTQFTHLLGTLQRSDSGRIEAHIPEGWMQGRTTYGGLTAALSLESARAIADDIPLRSAQVAFVGPVGGDVVVTPTLLRRGKNTAFVSVTVVGEKGCAAQSIFAFGIKRDSALDFSSVAPPEVGEPNEVESFFGGGPRPAFANHFNIRLAAGARPISGADEADLSLWLRHKDEAAIYNATTLLALADAPPPAAMALFKQPAPLSSMIGSRREFHMRIAWLE
ncbi:MAG: acyl-CoA thioesterase domain-containing protein [Pseudomonadota bacterium]